MDFVNIIIAVLVFVGLSAITGVLISLCGKVFRVEVDPRIEKITSLLPGANCGGCGFPGCSGMAEAVVSGKAKASECKPAKKEVIEEINGYLKLSTGPNGEYLPAKND